MNAEIKMTSSASEFLKFEMQLKGSERCPFLLYMLAYLCVEAERNSIVRWEDDRKWQKRQVVAANPPNDPKWWPHIAPACRPRLIARLCACSSDRRSKMPDRKPQANRRAVQTTTGQTAKCEREERHNCQPQSDLKCSQNQKWAQSARNHFRTGNAPILNSLEQSSAERVERTLTMMRLLRMSRFDEVKCRWSGKRSKKCICNEATVRLGRWMKGAWSTARAKRNGWANDGRNNFTKNDGHVWNGFKTSKKMVVGLLSGDDDGGGGGGETSMEREHLCGSTTNDTSATWRM